MITAAAIASSPINNAYISHRLAAVGLELLLTPLGLTVVTVAAVPVPLVLGVAVVPVPLVPDVAELPVP